jgi:hypothetical protein
MRCKLPVGLLAIALLPTALLQAVTYNCTAFHPPFGNLVVVGFNNAGLISGYWYGAGGYNGTIGNPVSGSYQTVDFPGAAGTYLLQINQSGVGVGSYLSPQGTGYFAGDANGNFRTITAPTGFEITNIWGINDSGAVSVELYHTNGGGGTFAILNPDGTYTLMPGQSMYGGRPKSLNNAPQFLADTFLDDAAGNLTLIQFVHPDGGGSISFGLNNNGFVTGAFGGSNSYGFLRDASGNFSEIMCPGVPATATSAYAINDANAVAGYFNNGYYIATPLPGAAQTVLSTTSVTFPPTGVGVTSAPQTFTITNNGNVRLDIGALSIAQRSSNVNFALSGCLDPNTHATSLDPGASCTVSVTATPTATGAATGIIAIDNSAPGAPHTVSLSVQGTSPPPPSCVLSGISGTPPETATFMMQDTNSGLSSILLSDSTNANVNIPSFAKGTMSSVTVTATQVDSAQSSKVDFEVTNVAGTSTACGTTFGAGAAAWTSLGGGILGKAGVGINADGRLEAFVHGSDNALWHNWQDTPDGAWSGWESLGGTISSDPTVAVNSDGRLEVFVTGSDNAVWHRSQTTAGTDNWSAWDSLGGDVNSDIAAIANADGRLEIFARGSDFGIWHNWQTVAGSSWSGWASLGNSSTSDPAVAINSDGRLEAFMRGTDCALWTAAQSSPGSSDWTAWQSLAGCIGNDTAVTANVDGRLEAFVRGDGDNALWHNAQTTPGGSWSGWSSLFGDTRNDPSVVANADGRLEAFVTGSDGAMWHNWQTSPGGSWAGFTSLEGSPVNTATGADNKDGRIQVFVIFPDTSLWTIEQVAAGNWQ